MSDETSYAADPTPSTIGRYQITGTLGFGAMGAVYRAFDPLIKRPLAIKTIRLDVPKQSPQHKTFIERFYQEARISGTLSHPNIVTLFDIGEDRGAPFLAMEFVDGETVATILEEGRHFKPEVVVGLVSQVAAALDYAHSRGIVHRDIKPSNLIVHGGDRIKVTDFGIAKIADAEITHTGTLLGSPAYMSPEQAMGEKVDGRSDIFSLGVVAFEMLSGQQPFPGANVTAILYKLVHVDPVEPADLEMNGLLPQKWREVFGKVLAKKPQSRYSTAGQFVQDLEYCLGSWFSGLGDETITLQTLSPDAQTATGASRLPTEATETRRDGSGTPAPASGGERPGGATLVAGDAVDSREAVPPTVVLPPPPASEPLAASAPPQTEPALTLPPEVTVRPPAPASASGSPPAATRRPPERLWIGLAAAATLALGLVGWTAFRTLAASPKAPAEPRPARAEPTPVPPAVPTTGALRVRAEPAGARVSVDGEQRGEAPLDLTDLAFGTHQVRVEAPGHQAQEQDVSLGPGSPSAEVEVRLEPVAVRTAPTTGIADVLSSPPGASVTLDGRAVGRTPLTGLRLAPGTRRVELALQGHEPWSGRLQVTAGKKGGLNVKLQPVPTPPPPTPAPVDTARVYQNVASEVDVLARKASGDSPSYPSERAPRLGRGQRVSVVVHFVVTAEGEVEDVKVVESAGAAVDDVVVSAVRRWKFHPALKRGTPVKVEVSFKQTFLGG